MAQHQIRSGDTLSEIAERYGVRGQVEARDGVLELSLAPFPLAGATTFQIPCRTVPQRAYAGDADLAVELALARWGTLAVRIVEVIEVIEAGEA